MIADIEPLAPDNLPPDLRTYLPTAEANAKENLKRAEFRDGKAILETLSQCTNSNVGGASVGQKLRRVRHLAAEFSDQLTPYAACKNGCSHCCNKSVQVAKSEAKLIALCIGTPLAKLVMTHRAGDKMERTSYQDKPCTFLENGKCSIYKHRPLVCRMLVNMDNEERLCKLIPNVSVPVPYINSSIFQMFYADLLGKNNLADVREWFPKGLR